MPQPLEQKLEQLMARCTVNTEVLGKAEGLYDLLNGFEHNINLGILVENKEPTPEYYAAFWKRAAVEQAWEQA